MNTFIKVLFSFLLIVSIFAIVAGFYMMLQNINKNETLMFIWIGVLLGGVAILGGLVLFIVIGHKKINK